MKIILCYCQCYEAHVMLLQAPNDRQLAGCDFGGLEDEATPARTLRYPYYHTSKYCAKVLNTIICPRIIPKVSCLRYK